MYKTPPTGLYEDPSTGWIEGAAILFAVLLVATVTATNDYRKESQFRKLNAKKDDVTIGVIRAGQAININVKELVGQSKMQINYWANLAVWLVGLLSL